MLLSCQMGCLPMSYKKRALSCQMGCVTMNYDKSSGYTAPQQSGPCRQAHLQP